MTITWGPSTYPVGLDTFFTSSTLTDHVDEVIANHPNTLGDAIVALQTKLGIDGDPATGLGGLSITAVSSNPGVAGSPTIWVDNSGGPNYVPKFTDELGVTIDLGGAGTLQDAYDGGNTIAATGAGGTVSISVANTENVDGLSITQNDSTNNPNALVLTSNTTFNTSTGAGASLQFSGSNSSVFSDSANPFLIGSLNGLNILTANGSLDLTATESAPSGAISAILTSFPQIPATSDCSVTVSSNGGINRGANSAAYLLSNSGNGGDFDSLIQIYSTSIGGTSSSDSAVNIRSYANGVSTGFAGTSTVNIEAWRNVSAGVDASTITLTDQTLTTLTESHTTFSSGDELRLNDGNRLTSTWSQGYITLSDNSTEWDNLEANCGGEVSLIQALNLAFSPSATITWFGTTTDAAATEIYLNGVSPNRYSLTADQTDVFFLKVIARDNTNNKSKVWEIKCAADSDGFSTSALVDTPIYTTIAQTDTSGSGTGTDLWSVSVSVNDTDDTFRITVTGQAASTIGWLAVS